LKLRWLVSARTSLQAQLIFIADDNPAAARKVRGRIHDTVRNLCAFPNSGRGGSVPGTREPVVPGSPFPIVYRLSADSVDILRVLHTSTNWQGTGS
jgi:toxin ParE1/3/4